MIMVKIPWIENNLQKRVISKKQSPPKTEDQTVSFESFNADNITREWKVSSISLRIKDIEPFEKNVRTKYNTEELETLKESIKQRSDIGNIDVFHIKKWDRYIISDGHRTYKAYSELYGPDKKIEVIIRREVDDITPDVELLLMQVGFVTSNTKQNLWFYEEASSIKKYLSQMDEMNPDKEPHKISQINIYSKLGLNKSKAMKYNSILQKFSSEELDSFEEDNVSYKMLLDLVKVSDKNELSTLRDKIKDGDIESPLDIQEYVKNREEALGQVEEIQNKDSTHVEKGWNSDSDSVQMISSFSKKICRKLVNINPHNLSKEENESLCNSLNNITRIIKEKQIW